MTATNTRRPSWPYVVLAVLALAIQSGWQPVEVRNLAVVLLVLIAVIYTSRK
ncbi:hypothetical protein [Streptomyces sp. NPDC001820]|uniref:hypothetical protein n=1 Tax=Streptomyces sp. NPDC001820 TaxID=3364613 RepID=UPI003683F711